MFHIGTSLCLRLEAGRFNGYAALDSSCIYIDIAVILTQGGIR
jgi:hypothetical protein